jgi:hypothetical protein
MSASYRMWLTVRCQEAEVASIKDALMEVAGWKFGVVPLLRAAEGMFLDAVGDLVIGDDNRALERKAYEVRCAVWYAAQRRVAVEVYHARMEPESGCPEGEHDFERAIANGDARALCANCQGWLPFGSHDRLCTGCASK